MSDHEQVHEAREQEADRLERENERLDESIDAARDARDQAASDPFVATEKPEEPDQSGPEADYPTKD